MSTKQYTSMKYINRVKKLKSLIRRYDETAILDACLNYLYAPTDDEIDHLRRNPWIVLLVVKWAFMGKSKIEYRRDQLDNKAAYHILQSAYELGSLVKMPTEYSHANIFMRNMAYQQFIYQHSFSMLQHGRQSLLFGSLPDNHKLKVWFYNKYGVSCNDFISLSFSLLTYFVDRKNHTIDVMWFAPLFPLYSRRTVETFLDAICIEMRHLKKGLTLANNSKGGYSEYYEQTPFILFPLIKHQEKYTCVHPYILYRCM